MTLENNRVPLLKYIKFFASFQNHGWIQTTVTARKRSIRVKIGDFLSRVTLKFDGWHWKTIGHIFYVSSSLVHHSIAIIEYKRELQSGNAQFGSKSMFFVRCDLKIWQMTLRNNTAPLLCYFKLCASFRSHWWIHTGVTVRKLPIWVTIYDFLGVWLWNLTDDFDKQQGTSLNKNQALCIISSLYVNSNCSYGPETAKLGFDLCDLDLWPLSLTFLMNVTSVIGNNFWKFHDDTMMGTLSKRCKGQTDRRTDWTIHRAAWSQLKIDWRRGTRFVVQVSNVREGSWSTDCHSQWPNASCCYMLGLGAKCMHALVR